MTRERAQYILDNTVYGEFKYAYSQGYRLSGIIHPDGITREEREAVMRLWDTMPGNTCFYDAVCRIAQGRAET